MRKIEKEMLEALDTYKFFSKNNTFVEHIHDGSVEVHLHGNLIAKIFDNQITLYDGGWQSKTTKSRLNCLLNHYELPQIYQKDYQWYIGKEEWTGQKTFSLGHCQQSYEPEPKEFDAVLGGQNLQPSPYDLVFSRKVKVPH